MKATNTPTKDLAVIHCTQTQRVEGACIALFVKLNNVRYYTFTCCRNIEKAQVAR